MSDLIEKFFRQDLTEAEKNTLNQELATSDESAQRFGELAEQAYLRFGLPEPEWTGPDNLKPNHESGRWRWILGGIVLAALFLVLGVKLFIPKTGRFNPSVASKSAPSFKSSSINLTSPPKEEKRWNANKSQALAAAPQVTPILKPVPTSTKSLVSGSTPMAPLASVPSPLPPLAPQVTPVNVDQNPNHPFSSLAVQLHLSGPRSLLVRVLDAHGNELLPLFNGSLPAGAWVFEWNGLLRDGRLAPPGMYNIEVKAGSWSQTKLVVIQN